MWIIPSNHPLYSAFAQECVASKEELSALSDQHGLSLLWKSKPLSSKIWSGKWNRVYWLPHLFGRTLKPSHQNSFTERYTASLEDTLANRFPLPESSSEPKTPDTSGPTFSGSLLQLGLFGASSKTSPDISPSDLEKSDLNYKAWVTKLRREYSQRLKQALRIRENDSSSSQWTTPMASDINRNTKFQQGGTALSMQVKEMWPTPTTMESEHQEEKFKARQKRLKERNTGKNGTKRSGNGAGPNLATKVQWSTPTARDSKNPDLPDSGNFKRKTENGWTIDLNSQVIAWPTPKARDAMGMTQRGVFQPQDALPNMVRVTDGQVNPDNPNSNGNNLVLNPAWVLQLMGTTLEKTFFEWQAMESLNNQQKLPSKPSSENTV